jgi:Flp pilus assembly pilin Flp
MNPQTVARTAGAFVRDRSGQDVIEYALLAALFGLGLLAVAPVMEQAIAQFYQATNECAQDQWQIPDPGGSNAACP